MKIKDAHKLTEGRWLNLYDVNYVAESGVEKSWQIVTRQKEPKCVTGRYRQPDAVVIVPFHTAKDKLVILQEYRVPLADYEVGFPAGLIDPGESVEQATRRELIEETGLTVGRFIRISPPIYSSAGMTDESVSMVYVECEGMPSTDANTASEMIEILLVSPGEVLELLKDENLKFDAKAWLVISRFAETERCI